ncbi:helix-turn-helix domain-containing protein [Dethiobacter alkaliphilus]|uniref:transcriptional regulator n=1 Tax=Dethiobacter alkaliphilus TaxID=427926 RepID=UPI002226F690|nr:transcriptional regulator [Dethiobacter alkaliphilus]MCW3491583.1 transcriptional regulator [Dethiobacter alkaliphilus]
MFFSFGFKNKTIKELRKNRGFTAKELALRLRVNVSLVKKVDNTRLKNVPEPLQSKLVPHLRGDN